jgi:hypothetical protein
MDEPCSFTAGGARRWTGWWILRPVVTDVAVAVDE